MLLGNTGCLYCGRGTTREDTPHVLIELARTSEDPRKISKIWMHFCCTECAKRYIMEKGFAQQELALENKST